jgi:glycine oxidase
MNCDVVVIGAGVMGCAVAWRLLQRGLSVVLVERGVPGAEASSAAAGILAPQAEADGPGPFLDLALRSRALYPAFVAELQERTGVDVGYRKEGTLVLAGVGAAGPDAPEAEAEVAALRAQLAWQQRAGLKVAQLSREALHEAEPALAPCALGLHFPDDHQVEAEKLTRALSLVAAQAGARFVRAHVQRVLHDGERALGVVVEGETLSSACVVVAAGSWSSLVQGSTLPPRAVRPMRGQMVEIDTRPPALRHVVFGHVKSGPGPSLSGYLVPRHDGRLVAGSTMELVGFRKEVTVSGLSRLLRLCEGLAPPLGEAEVRRTWAGFRPYTEDALPILGPTSVKGLYLCTGHFRNGILLTPISAESVCACITGAWATGVEPLSLSPFSLRPASE